MWMKLFAFYKNMFQATLLTPFYVLMSTGQKHQVQNKFFSCSCLIVVWLYEVRLLRPKGSFGSRLVGELTASRQLRSPAPASFSSFASPFSSTFKLLPLFSKLFCKISRDLIWCHLPTCANWLEGGLIECVATASASSSAAVEWPTRPSWLPSPHPAADTLTHRPYHQTQRQLRKWNGLRRNRKIQ